MKINGFEPPLSMTLREYPSTVKMAIMCLLGFPGMLWDSVWEPRGSSHPIVLIPGFGAPDLTTMPLRFQVWWRKHRPVSSGMGINLGVDDNVATAFYRKMVKVYQLYEEPLVFVGHSLGGAIGNVFAHRHPEMVHMVITLGSPHRVPEGNVLVKKLIELVSGTEHLKNTRLKIMIENPSPVPTYAFTADSDGFLSRDCTQVKETEHSENFFFPGSHCGLIVNPLVWKKIFELIRGPGISLKLKMERKEKIAELLGIGRPRDYDWGWC